MSVAVSGRVRGNTITLDHNLAELEGKRVRVVVEPADDLEQTLSTEQQALLWQAWIERGLQRPITEKDETLP